MFNSMPFYNTTSSAMRGRARQLNPLLQALNEHPKHILVIPDRDIINETKAYGFGASYILGSVIYFLIKQIDILLARCQIDLMEKKLGTVIEDGPIIIWTRDVKVAK